MKQIIAVLAVVSLIAGCTTTAPNLTYTDKQEVTGVTFQLTEKVGSRPRYGNSKLFLQVNGQWSVITEEYTNGEGKFESSKFHIRTEDLISYEMIEN